MLKYHILIKSAAFLGAISVMLGAFAAHGLKSRLSDYSMGIFETAVKYQFYHVFAILGLGLMVKSGIQHPMIAWSFRFFVTGIILFSGSLYALSLLAGKRWLGMITPFGGLCLIAGWICLFLAFSGKQNC
jgi:uncharacterized membrane protein YgdD (TMEM256/DUF423 family)